MVLFAFVLARWIVSRWIKLIKIKDMAQGRSSNSSFFRVCLVFGISCLLLVLTSCGGSSSSSSGSGGSGGGGNGGGGQQVTVPATPTGLAATAGNQQVGLTWSASSGAASYNVKRGTASGGPYTTGGEPDWDQLYGLWPDERDALLLCGVRSEFGGGERELESGFGDSSRIGFGYEHPSND